MAWTSLSFSVGQVLTAAQMNNLQANFAALAANDTGSPNITKITPAIQTSGTTTIAGSGGTWTPAAGIYAYSITVTNAKLQIYQSGVWREEATSETSGILITDGTNTRLINNALADATVYYHKMF